MDDPSYTIEKLISLAKRGKPETRAKARKELHRRGYRHSKQMKRWLPSKLLF